MTAGPRKGIAILGSTGSIGTQTLDVIANNPDRFNVVALAAGAQTTVLLEQARRFGPAVVSCAREEDAPALQRALPSSRVAWGSDGLLAATSGDAVDLVVAATDGMVALDAVFAALERGVTVALANKELIVGAGELLFAAARAGGATILPVDSEHSALFQCLVGEPAERIATLVLTASGGPFWRMSREAIHTASLADALRHPTWQMGVKNTIDSATMMNKGLEAIEASRFFGVGPDRIAVLVHPTSIAHGFAIFTDGSIKAQLAPPDMRIPIGYALAYPDRLPGRVASDPIAAIGGEPGLASLALTFERPDPERFPCLELAFEALRAGGTAPAALSAANEVAVAAFVAGKIGFGEIAEIVAAVLAGHPSETLSNAAVRTADLHAREVAAEAVAERSAGGLSRIV